MSGPRTPSRQMQCVACSVLPNPVSGSISKFVTHADRCRPYPLRHSEIDRWQRTEVGFLQLSEARVKRQLPSWGELDVDAGVERVARDGFTVADTTWPKDRHVSQGKATRCPHTESIGDRDSETGFGSHQPLRPG